MKIKEILENHLGTIIDVQSYDSDIVYDNIRKYYRWIKLNEEYQLLPNTIIQGHKLDFAELVDEFIDQGFDAYLSTRRSTNLKNLRDLI